MAYRLGVDLGTTFTAAAVRRDGVSRMATLGVRQPEMPSVVAVSKDGVRVGDDAEYHGRTEPASIARFFKRRFADSTPLVVNGQPWSAEALSARLLRRVLDEVAAAEGSAPEHVVLTHPAGWREFRLDAMHTMAQMAEVASYHLVPEPVAAARHYAASNQLPNDARLAVFDFGGGTFDTSIVAVSNGEFEVIGTPQGIERLGGIDIDEAVFTHVCGAAGVDPYSLPETPDITRDLQRLRAECRDAKEILSTSRVARVAVQVGGFSTDVELDRGEFESMLTPMLDDAGAAVDRAIRMVGLSHDEIDALLLVGGTSRIPAVGAALSERFGRPILVDTHPKHSVALGATLSEPPASAGLPPHPAGLTVQPTPPTNLSPPTKPAAQQIPAAPATLAESGFGAVPPAASNSTLIDAGGAGLGDGQPPDGGAYAAAKGAGATSRNRGPLLLVLAAVVLAVAGSIGFALTRGGASDDTASDDTASDGSASDEAGVEEAASTTEAPTEPPTTETPTTETPTTETPTTTAAASAESDLVIVAKGDSIQIRLLGDVSGPFADIGQAGVDLSEQAIVDFGSVNGFDVAVGSVLDTACNQDAGAAAAEVVADTPDVIGVIGPQCSGSILGASPVTTASGPVLIAPAGGWPTLTSDLHGTAGADYHDGFYRLLHNDLVHPVALASYATEELGLTRAGVIHAGLPFELELSEAFVSRFEANGGEVVVIEDLSTDSTVGGLAQVMVDADVDFIYVLVPSNQGGAVLAALDGQGDWTTGGSHFFLDEQFLSAPASADLILTAPETVDLSNVNQDTGRSGSDVLAEYASVSASANASGVGARSYDATILLLSAIEASSTVDNGNLVIDRVGVAAFLDGISGYSGLSGPIECDDFGDCTRNPILVLRNVNPADFSSIETLDRVDDFG